MYRALSVVAVLVLSACASAPESGDPARAAYRQAHLSCDQQMRALRSGPGAFDRHVYVTCMKRKGYDA